MRMRNRTKVAFLQLNRRDFFFLKQLKACNIQGRIQGCNIAEKKPIQKRKVFFYWEKSQIVFLRTNPCIFK